MLNRRTRTAFLVILLSATAMASAAHLVPGQIRTIEIPPSQPEPTLPPPELAAPATPETEPSSGLILELPTIDEARAIDADAGGDLAKSIEDPAELDAEAVARAIGAVEAARLRDANTEQLAAARRQLDQIEAEKQAERDRLARYREAEAAHAATMADYQSQLEAARAARQRWERDVVACQAGDWSRCEPRVTPN